MTQEFVVDQYGNYILQYIIDMKDLAINCQIADKLAGRFVELANHKFSSNVIEKVLLYNAINSALSLIRKKRKSK